VTPTGSGQVSGEWLVKGRTGVNTSPPRRLCFLTQSVETIENKRVVFFVSAKKCKRVWKQQEVKEIDEAKEIKE